MVLEIVDFHSSVEKNGAISQSNSNIFILPLSDKVIKHNKTIVLLC